MFDEQRATTRPPAPRRSRRLGSKGVG